MNGHHHEIGNVLGILIGNAQLLALEDLDPSSKDMVDEILAAAEQLRTLLLPENEGEAN